MIGAPPTRRFSPEEQLTPFATGYAAYRHAMITTATDITS
jgi:hypothetical protein